MRASMLRSTKPLHFSALTWWGWCWAAPGFDSLTGLCQLRRHKLVHLMLQSILRSSAVSTADTQVTVMTVR